MSNNTKQDSTKETGLKNSLRLWPGTVLVILQWVIWQVLPAFFPETIAIGVFGSLVFGLAVILWWAFFSRANRFDRWSAVAAITIAMAITSLFIHESVKTAMMGLMFPVFALPILCSVFVIWAVLTRRLQIKPRRILMFVTIIFASVIWLFIRTDGMDGSTHQDFNWRWAETHEEQLLTQTGDEQMILLSDQTLTDTVAEWPGFRGPNRDGIIHGISINTNWTASPPEELWRKQIGPGCSSFAIHNNLLYTQEQRGEVEIVSCYNFTTGEPVWRHNDSARFWDSHAGAGPRSTPTLSNSRVYTFGATGILNALKANDGSVVWSRYAASENNVEIPEWGISSSPLVVDNVVIVAVSGTLAAYDIETGKLRWVGPDGGISYSSPHLLTIEGSQQVLMMNKNGATAFNPSDGKVLWEHLSERDERILQPTIVSEGKILISAGLGEGARLIELKKENKEWETKELWTSTGLTPYFNDFVIHKGYAYGFKGPRLACIDLKDGKRMWKDGRYGGQIILLADQDLLFVLSEKGELVLVEAVPDHFKELTKYQAIDGKTWNHPVIVDDILLVRNSKEMAAFRLPLNDNL